MQSTGIVRRIDELGRIVIPKEIRRTFHIRESDLLEIFTKNSEEIILKKHSVIGQIPKFADRYSEILSKFISAPVLVTDKESVVAVSGVPKREFISRKITSYIKQIMEERKNFSENENKGIKTHPIEGLDNECLFMFPIISNGDLCGSIIVLKNANLKNIDLKNIEKIAKISAEFLSSQLED